MHVAIVNYPYPAQARSPAELLARFPALTGWAEALRAAGARVTVLQRFSADGAIERAGVRYQLVREPGGPNPAGWRAPRRLHAAALAAAPDAVHLHGQIFPLQALALRRALPRRAALLVQHHGGDPPAGAGPRALARRALYRLGLRAADGFMFTAAEMADAWRAAGMIGPGRPVYAVVEASTELRAPEGPPAPLPGRPALLWVGRLHPVKDPLTVLDGFALALRELPGATLSMAFGSEELLGAVRARVARADLVGRVRLLGRVEHGALPALYAGADMFVLGSRREAAGFALIEALACGLSPAVTDIAPFRAVAGGVGARWPAGSPAGCAAAILSLARGDRAAARAAARARFEQALSWPAIGAAALAAYNDLVGRRCELR